MTNEKTPKNPSNYFCKFCNFSCSNKKDYNRHELTAKHQIRSNTNEKTPKNPKNEYRCSCNKIYKHASSLWNHKQKCSYVKVDMNVEINTDMTDNNTIMNLLKQNNDFKELIIEQNKTIIELSKNTGSIINNTNTTNNNQKFNLNFFLNTTCKDAMNMSEFIENIEVNFKDIENIGKNGYVSGMTDMILSRIKELDVTKRPMHCTDLKRETLYIKDNDEWTKDTPENTKFHQMMDYVAKQNYAKMPLWRQRNPECLDSDHPKYDFCIKMMRNMLGDVGAEQKRLDNKVLKNLSKHILVDKAVN